MINLENFDEKLAFFFLEKCLIPISLQHNAVNLLNLKLRLIDRTEFILIETSKAYDMRLQKNKDYIFRSEFVKKD